MTLENIIILLVVLTIFIFGTTIVQFITFLYYQFEYSIFKRVKREEVDVNILEIMKVSENFLEKKGFVFQSMLEHESNIVGNDLKYYIAYYYNHSNGVHAFVKTQPYRGAQEAVSIVYKTIYENGNRVETVNGMKHFIQIMPSNVSLYDYYLVDNEAIYRAHLNDREKEQSTVDKNPISEDEIISFKIEDEKGYIQSWVDANLIKYNNTGYRFKFSWTTWKFAMQSVKGYKKYAKILRNRKEADTFSDKGGATHALMAQLEEMDKPRGKSNKKLWFGISLAIFIVIFGLLGISFADILMLVIVLLVHELGHYLAMRYYGYTDTSIFFLPFGAAAVGRKEYRNAYEEYIVFLAGPLPGLLIGTGILIWGMWQHQMLDRENYLSMYALMSIVINYINLLPIYPLDGGRILQLLLLHRYPKGQFYFYMVSLTLLVVAMVWLQDPVLLIFVGIVALGVKQSYRVSQFLSKLFTQFKPKQLDKNMIVDTIVQDDMYKKETLHTKANLAKQILHIVQTSKPSKWLIGFGLLFYFLCLMPPFALYYKPPFMNSKSEYSQLPKEGKKQLDAFNTNISSYKGLTEASSEDYELNTSLKTIEQYLYNTDLNRTVAEPLKVKESNIAKLPEDLQQIYLWHDGITELQPDRDLFTFKELERNHLDILKDQREYEDENFTTPYRIFISNYGYRGLAYHLTKEGIYSYSPYNYSDENIKRYYSINHLFKLISEAYKEGIYYYDYDELETDELKWTKLQKAYLSQKDKQRYEAKILYLQKMANEFKNSPYGYIKKELLRTLSSTHDSRVIPLIQKYLLDENKKVRQQAVHSLGVVGDRSVIPLLLEQLEESPMHCKGCAISGLTYLANSSDDVLLDKIYPAVYDNRMWIRRNSYRLIGYIQNLSSLPLLKERFKKEHPACKLVIVEAFGRIGNTEILPLLQDYLRQIEAMDFSVSYKNRSRIKNPHPSTLKYEVQKAIHSIQIKSKK